MEIVEVLKKDEKKLRKLAVFYLAEGKVIMLETDTVCGLVADAENKKAVKKIFKIKNRPPEKTLPIFSASLSMARKIAKISDKQAKSIGKKWPGKYTFVFDIGNGKKLSRQMIGRDKSVAIRVPKNAFLLSVIEAYKKPLAQTSANISKQPASADISEAIKCFENKRFQPDLVFVSRGGRLPKTGPSTIVDLRNGKGKIIRK